MSPPPTAETASPRIAFADYRPNGTSEVTTLGREAEARTEAAELRFGDLLDVVNPLQHIPGLSSIYRGLTGDEISAPARVLGAALYTGPIGFVLATADTLFAEVNGRYLGDGLMAALTTAPSAIQVEPAAASTAEAPRLEGADALSALARDLRRPGPPAAASANGATDPTRPEPPRSPAFLQNMTRALDKYRVLAQTRQTGSAGQAAAPTVPASHRPTWPLLTNGKPL